MSLTRQLPLVWHGPLHDPSGYADEGRMTLFALERAGYEVAARPIRWDSLTADLTPDHAAVIERAERRRAVDPHVSVLHLQPRQDLAPRNGARVSRTMFETDRVPAGWLPSLLEYDEIWVPSEHAVKAFMRAGVPEPRLAILPQTVDFELFAPGAEPLRLGEPGRFTFLTNFDFTERKGWDVLLDAWARAFAPDDGVQLVLKCLRLHAVGDVTERIASHLGGRSTAPIVVETSLLAAADMPRLYAGADAFVLPTRGEGWGRPYMEAMASGLPTIGSRWGGNLAFMTDENSWLLDGEVRPIESWHPLPESLWRGHRWFEPDVDALVDAFREVARGGAAVAARAAAARPSLQEHFGYDQIAARIAELTERVLERTQRSAGVRPHCVWRGDFGSGHSLAVVNDGHALALERSGKPVSFRAAAGLSSDSDAVGVAGQWPPSFEPPSKGPFVLYQPWEYGRIPRRWVEAIRNAVDEVWVPSRFVRDAYVASGVGPELVQVVPNGVDIDRFAPEGPRRELGTAKSTVFLFVGGTIHRKGVDVLLAAYRAAFTADDDVCLVIKGFGSTTMYRGQGAEALIAAAVADPAAPEILFLEEEVPFDELPALYRAADVLVQPYRAEGFCLPALEALACGVPVIVTDGGPTDDFVSDECAWRIASSRVPMQADAFADSDLVLAGTAFTLEPDADALAGILREAADPAARRSRAANARRHAERFSWDEAAKVAAERIAALDGRTPIRTVPSASVPDRRGFLFLVPADWEDADTWVPALRAYVEAFSDDDDVTLLFPSTGSSAELGLLERELELTGADAASTPDIALADPTGQHASALELAADAVIGAAENAARARRVVSPDPAALRAAFTSQEAA